MIDARTVRRLWHRGQRGWPESFPLVQLPNAPLLVAMGATVVAARTDGTVRAGARAASQAAASVWAWRELTAGTNVLRRAMGAAALAHTAARVRHRARSGDATPGP